jgi:hypothetical protein
VLRFATFALLALNITIGSTPAAERARVEMADTLGRFPSVEGSNLEGEHFQLPSGFEASLNVVLVAFKREQQSDIDEWMPFLNTLRKGQPTLRVYELPTLGRRYRLMRSFIDGGMRRGIPDAAVRSATITLYIDKAPFRESLRLPDEDRIYVLLVDREGRVFWRASGRFDELAAAELARRVDDASRANGAGG